MAIGEPNISTLPVNPDFPDSSPTVIARHPAFEEFYGMEDAIEMIVSI